MDIKNEDDYKKVLDKLNEVFDAKPGTKEGSELEKFFKLIEEWEDKMYPLN